jgi:hypothetical protein
MWYFSREIHIIQYETLILRVSIELQQVISGSFSQQCPTVMRAQVCSKYFRLTSPVSVFFTVFTTID